MEDCGNPYLLIVLIGIIVLLTVALCVVLYTFRKSIAKEFKKNLNKKNVTEDDVIEEEIISMVKEGQKEGYLLESEAEMIHNIFEYGDKEAKDIMTHRNNIVAIDGNMSFYDMVAYVDDTGKSRFPVYLDDIDNIIGVLHIKDAFLYCQKNEIFRTSVKDIPELIRDVDFITETIKINSLFKKMQSEKNHMCIVIDEYGQTSGLVAMEDILEEIVGDIEDEHDEEEQMYSVASDGSYTFDGLTELPDVLELVPLPVEEDAFETLNGYVISLLEKVPSDDEHDIIEKHGFRFEILHVENRIIREVRITKTYEDLEDNNDANLRD
ncbi:MAG: HlyC/CorC family transporter [Agathobacter sp.]|nr:HlyC/CorC family transporter [Agathobacter sp.]